MQVGKHLVQVRKHLLKEKPGWILRNVLFVSKKSTRPKNVLKGSPKEMMMIRWNSKARSLSPL